VTENIVPTKLEVLHAWTESADRPALIGLVVANLLPLLLAVVFGWELGSIVILYWWENLITGFFAVLRIMGSRGGMASGPNSKLFLVPFFCVHYFFFCFVHGTLVMHLMLGESQISGPFESETYLSFCNALPQWGLVSLVVIFGSHAVSFWRHYVRGGEYAKTSPDKEMFRPYRRIALLHICIIAGGALTMVLGTPMIMVLLLIVGKTIMDAAMHVTLHNNKDKAT